MFNGFVHSVVQPVTQGFRSVTRIFFSLPALSGEEDDLQNVGTNTQGYSGWILIPSGVAVHSTLDAISETLTNVAENKVGYEAWIRVPSGVNIPTILEEILFNGDFITNVGTSTQTIEEVITGTPIPEPEPTPVVPSPGVGGGTYAPIFPEKPVPKLAPIKEVLTNRSKAFFEATELTTVTDDLAVRVVNSNTVTGWYRKRRFVAYPTLPDVDIPPKEIFKTPRFPDELPNGITASQRRKRQQNQLLLLDLI